MARFLKFLILVPVTLLGLAFAVANRHEVTVSFDPFSDVSTASFEMRLFVVIFGALICGVIIGSCATWFTQGKNRRAARLSRAEADRLRGETERLRAQIVPADRVRSLLHPS